MNKEMSFIEWQKYLQDVAISAFGITESMLTGETYYNPDVDDQFHIKNLFWFSLIIGLFSIPKYGIVDAMLITLTSVNLISTYMSIIIIKRLIKEALELKNELKEKYDM